MNAMENGMTHFPYALGECDGEGILYVTRNPGCSSLLKPNMEVLKDYKFQTHGWDIMEEIPIPIVEGNTLIEDGIVPAPQFMKLDVQGYEAFVLKGLDRYLDGVWGFEIETHFRELYKGEKLFFEMYEWLTVEHNFTLRQLDSVSWYDGDQVEWIAHFTKGPGPLTPGPQYLIDRFWSKMQGLDEPRMSAKSDKARVDSPFHAESLADMAYYEKYPY